ncbi:guanitoxin biosynthesis heme-dependent pre-guanitoxin N-hydroxylase GntA [Streptomyces eurythermus]|uniref:guanitoxin biosynthesis heme-dependent pre-guanitoxin N-hydroxylase GntA n=1 Tax=Streptomyces eurythermus TaxID=42237 RepID=UPI0033D89D0D
MESVPPTDHVREQLFRWIRSDDFSCLAGKASLRKGMMSCARLGELGAEASTRELHARLQEFVRGRLTPTENFHTFVAIFTGPLGIAEMEFEKLLWQQLADLHELDRDLYQWAPEVAADPDSSEFGFSVVGHPFFVVGLHGRSSRVSRRFSQPALAFNSHHQFQRLKQNGTFEGLKKRIREREMRLQNSLNPNLADFGEASEARQYSGRAVEPTWTCPVFPPVRAAGPGGQQETTVRTGEET